MSGFFIYRVIEIIALWEGRLTTNHLCNTFGIGRQQASKDINAYLNEIAPNNLIYNKHLMGYEPSPQFKPRVTTGTADEYLHVLSRTKDLAHTFASLDLGFANTHMLQLPSRKVDPVILRTLVQAAREQKRVDIGYISVNNPATDGRIIVPHTLVCTPTRWHVRAYCEKNGQYRDFVLSRFRGEPDLLNKSEHGKADDTAWNTEIELSITPDPRLEKLQQKVRPAIPNPAERLGLFGLNLLAIDLIACVKASKPPWWRINSLKPPINSDKMKISCMLAKPVLMSLIHVDN